MQRFSDDNEVDDDEEDDQVDAAWAGQENGQNKQQQHQQIDILYRKSDFRISFVYIFIA